MLQLVEVNGQMVTLKPTKILIFDISSGGVRLHTRIDFPTTMNMIVRVTFTLLGDQIQLIGELKRKKVIREHLFEYGISFITDHAEQQMLNGHINTLAVRLRKTLTNHIKSCSFSTEEEIKEMYSY